ncbi:MAG TPA: hypothetical protein VMT53_04265 [Terriglobales bacterium]|nr:hypothetical protein [Terriglobales bacterium]
MLGDLTNIPDDTLLNIGFAILQAGRLTSDEIADLEQLQSELQHRSSCPFDQD